MSTSSTSTLSSPPSNTAVHTACNNASCEICSWDKPKEKILYVELPSHASNSLRYILYFLSVKDGVIAHDVKYDVVKAHLNTLNWLTFNWKKLPQPVFEECFNLISETHLIFMCGFFKCIPSMFVRKDMIVSLFSHFQNTN